MNTNTVPFIPLPGVVEAIRQLPNGAERGILAAHLFGGLSPEEIARQTKTSSANDIRGILRMLEMKVCFHLAFVPSQWPRY